MDPIVPRHPPGGRRPPRPRDIEPCRHCGAPVGTTYPACVACSEAVDRYWQADWAALLAAQGAAPGAAGETALARVVLAQPDRHPWTVVDVAMSRVRCDACGCEMGGGPKDCTACEMAFGGLWAYDVEALYDGAMTGIEHALRVGRWVLRYPHRQSTNVVTAWRGSMPLLLTGGLPATRDAQAAMARIKKAKGS